MAKMHVKTSSIGNPTPGYSIKAYIGLVSEMTAIPAAAAGIVSTDITFAAGTPAKGFMQVHNGPKRQSSAASTVGEAGALSDNFFHTLFIPGDTAAVREFLKTIQKEPLIVLAKEGEQGGPWLMFGTEQNPAWVDSKSFESGQLADGTKGTTVVIFAKNKDQYTGTITEMGE